MLKSINKRYFSSFYHYTLNNNSNMIEALRHFYPEKDGVYTGIVSRFLANPEFLMIAYVLAKNKVSTSILQDNCDTTIVSYFSKDWFQKIAADIKCGTYKIKVSRSVSICTKTVTKPRFLVISDLKDKIIKKAIQLVLEEIYERKENFFSRLSHGFHCNKSYCSVFQQLKNE